LDAKREREREREKESLVFSEKTEERRETRVKVLARNTLYFVFAFVVYFESLTQFSLSSFSPTPIEAKPINNNFNYLNQIPPFIL
jgi:hypothetical protein